MIGQAFAWWLVIQVIGLLALPIVFAVCSGLPGRGYAFVKPLGLMLVGYGFWLLLSLHLLSNRPGSIVWILLVIVAIDYLLLRNGRWRSLRETLEPRIGYIVAVELVFTLGFFTAAHVRSFIPEITATEKPMDFMLLNASSRSRYYPPDDPWLAGAHVSYYYFGYVIQAMLAKLAAVKTSVAFNLAVASTAALAATAAFGLAYELISLARRATFRMAIGAGVLAVVIVSVMGNLEGVLEFGVANDLHESITDRVDIANLDSAGGSTTCLVSAGGHCIAYPSERSSTWWWWRATRISPNGDSITEFPFFSFLLGDLHPHYMALPFVLSVVGLGLSLWRAEGALAFDTWRRRPAFMLFVALALGGLSFLNTWDLPTFAVLVSLFVLARNLTSGISPAEAIKNTAGFIAPLGLASIVFYAPFYLSFSSQASGIDVVRDGATRPLHSFLFWAPMVAVALPLPLYILARDRIARDWRRLVIAAYLPIALFFAWAILLVIDHGGSSLSDAVTGRGWNWLTTAFFGAALTASVVALWRSVERRDDDAPHDPIHVPLLALTSLALLLVFGAELFYVRDVFGTRMNTVFKLYYQAWLLLGVSGAAGVVWLWQETRPVLALPRFRTLRPVWLGATALLVALALLYPLGATLSRSEGLTRGPRTLDGLAYAHNNNVDDFIAAEWLHTNAGRNESVMEAVGAPYSDAGRVSEWTGLPTVIGWAGHELQWGRDGLALGQRTADVENAYTTPSMADALAVLRKYDVTYVFVGSLEHATYPAAGLTKFDTGLETAFRSGKTVIYRVPPDGTSLLVEAP